MKIKPEDLDQLEAEYLRQAKRAGYRSLSKYIKDARHDMIEDGITPDCEATYILGGLRINEALTFVCDVLYVYMNDQHLATADHKIYERNYPST